MAAHIARTTCDIDADFRILHNNNEFSLFLLFGYHRKVDWWVPPIHAAWRAVSRWDSDEMCLRICAPRGCDLWPKLNCIFFTCRHTLKQNLQTYVYTIRIIFKYRIQMNKNNWPFISCYFSNSFKVRKWLLLL